MKPTAEERMERVKRLAEAALERKGLAVLALVVGSAGASLPEVILLKRVFRWPMLAAFLASVFFTAVMTGIAAELLH